MSEPLTGFVVTPIGVVMHAETHRKMVEQLKTDKVATALLVPAQRAVTR
jgi:hypothetical protein